MKRKIFTIVFACIFLQVIFSGRVTGITAVHITWAHDSSLSYCPVPINMNFWGYGTATGYPNFSNVLIQIYFGDGGHTAFTSTIDTFYHEFGFGNVHHNYTSTGSYTIKYVVTGPDGNSDSIIHINQFTLGDTCGNIDGRMYMDNNSNCVFDAGDSILRGFPVVMYENNIAYQYCNTDLNGYYWFNGATGQTYTVKPQNMSAYGVQVTCPTSDSITFTLATTSYNNDFGAVCLSGFDIETYLLGWRFTPGMDAYMDVAAFNNLCLPTMGTVKLILDPLVTYVSNAYGPTPIISGDTLIWNNTNYLNGHFSQYNQNWTWSNYNDFMNELILHTSSAAVIGDSVCFTMIAEPITGDVNPVNNTLHYCSAIRSSWDPNFKEVYPKGVDTSNDISADQLLTYTIHFQNTGTDTARNVAIYDTLDYYNLDINTFQPILADHPFRAEIVYGVWVKFSFENIMLPDSATNQFASQGFVTFNIKPKANTPGGTRIYNRAGIVFDYNLPVVTNRVHNRINLITNISEVATASSNNSIYPNPANTTLTIHQSTYSTQSTNQLIIEDVLGNKIYQQPLNNSTQSTIDISQWSAGIYFYEVRGEKESVRGKFVVQR